MRVLAALAMMVVASPVYAGEGPELSPDVVRQGMAAMGFASGGMRVIDGQQYRIESMTVEASGKWIVIRVLPRRMRVHPANIRKGVR